MSCPGCGNRKATEVTERFADAVIVFFNCLRCGFSTWNREEWEWE